MGLDAGGDCHHLISCGHFKVELDAGLGADDVDVAVCHVAAVFAEVHGDAVGVCEFDFVESACDVGLAIVVEVGWGVRSCPVASLAERGDVIDVDGEMGHGEG